MSKKVEMKNQKCQTIDDEITPTPDLAKTLTLTDIDPI